MISEHERESEGAEKLKKILVQPSKITFGLRNQQEQRAGKRYI
jgi:hypothetical protein